MSFPTLIYLSLTASFRGLKLVISTCHSPGTEFFLINPVTWRHTRADAMILSLFVSCLVGQSGLSCYRLTVRSCLIFQELRYHRGPLYSLVVCPFLGEFSISSKSWAFSVAPVLTRMLSLMPYGFSLLHAKRFHTF